MASRASLHALSAEEVGLRSRLIHAVLGFPVSPSQPFCTTQPYRNPVGPSSELRSVRHDPRLGAVSSRHAHARARGRASPSPPSRDSRRRRTESAALKNFVNDSDGKLNDESHKDF